MKLSLKHFRDAGAELLKRIQASRALNDLGTSARVILRKHKSSVASAFLLSAGYMIGQGDAADGRTNPYGAFELSAVIFAVAVGARVLGRRLLHPRKPTTYDL